MLASIHKSPEWEYEREWHLVVPLGDDGTEGFPFRMPKPARVLLGARMRANDKQDVSRIADDRGIAVVRMSLGATGFKLRENA